MLCVGAGGGGDGGARRSELFDQESSSASAHQIRDYFSRLIRSDSPEPSWVQTIAEHAKQDAVRLSVFAQNRPPHRSPNTQRRQRVKMITHMHAYMPWHVCMHKIIHIQSYIHTYMSMYTHTCIPSGSIWVGVGVGVEVVHGDTRMARHLVRDPP